MRTYLLLLLLLLGSAPALAQEILAQERWPDGTLRAARYSEGDQIHFITYHENGRVKEMGTFRKGLRHGTWKQYADSGALLTHATFQNGHRQGEWEFRTMADVPAGRLVFRNGELVRGEQFDAEGLLAAIREY